MADYETKNRQRPNLATRERQQAELRKRASALAGVLLALVLAFAAIGGAFSDGSEPDDGDTAAVAQLEADSGQRVTFVAVGDNLPNETIGAYADSLAGDVGDGAYDYASIFAPVKPYIESADIAYIDQETHVGGNEIGPSGYPSFNTTDEMADAVVQTGFDFVASATNHSYDWGALGALAHSVEVWEKQPVAFTGTAVTAEQYDSIATVERNGITFALLDYTYGVNGYTQDELPEYAVNFIDEQRIAQDVERAKGSADVVLVAMHWGTENYVQADDEQLRLAQFLADLDVDVVLGSHPHVIGPLEWVENSDGGGHRTLVAYSLGNFLADHEEPAPDNVLEGMLSCTFVRGDDGGVQIEDVSWTPLVCHADEARSRFAVYAVKDYPEALATTNRGLLGVENPREWLLERTAEITGLNDGTL